MMHPPACYSRHPANRRVSSTGFTLMEVLISISIIAITLTAVYRMHSQTLSMAGTAYFYATAPLLAQGKIAELRLRPADELGDDSGDFGDRHPSFSWQATITDVESELLERTKEDFKRLDVTIYLNGDQSSFSLRQYLFIR